MTAIALSGRFFEDENLGELFDKEFWDIFVHLKDELDRLRQSNAKASEAVKAIAEEAAQIRLDLEKNFEKLSSEIEKQGDFNAITDFASERAALLDRMEELTINAEAITKSATERRSRLSQFMAFRDVCIKEALHRVRAEKTHGKKP